MSHGSQMLYVSLKRRYSYNNHNNGRLYLSQRQAVRELRSHHNEIARWFRELQYYGFIVMMTPGFLGVDGHGKSPHWRLTELSYQRDPPTQDYLRWDGSRFKKKSKIPYRKWRTGCAGKGAHQRAGKPHA
jgi:hypothetical protein